MISLTWRPLDPGLTGWPGREIETSITEREARWLVRLADGRTALEVGSAYGFSAVAMGYVARHVVAIDRHDVHPASLSKMLANLAANGADGRVTIIVGDSLTVLASLAGT